MTRIFNVQGNQNQRCHQGFVVELSSLSLVLSRTNQIEKISNLHGLGNLKVLSLGRNSIKEIEGLDAVADTLEELWINYNQIERLNGIEFRKKLKVLNEQQQDQGMGEENTELVRRFCLNIY
ncbi:hypothetical protein BC830DRAFT_1120882 [Chytriomyces sp. MP71]|nr:hypothetical protein BC830DRAFT_1120882 [Chytriomyces sp. MP71]